MEKNVPLKDLMVIILHNLNSYTCLNCGYTVWIPLHILNFITENLNLTLSQEEMKSLKEFFNSYLRKNTESKDFGESYVGFNYILWNYMLPECCSKPNRDWIDKTQNKGKSLSEKEIDYFKSKIVHILL